MGGQIHVGQLVLKALLVTTQKNKHLLGNEQWGAVDGIKHYQYKPQRELTRYILV